MPPAARGCRGLVRRGASIFIGGVRSIRASGPGQREQPLPLGHALLAAAPEDVPAQAPEAVAERGDLVVRGGELGAECLEEGPGFVEGRDLLGRPPPLRPHAGTPTLHSEKVNREPAAERCPRVARRVKRARIRDLLLRDPYRW